MARAQRAGHRRPIFLRGPGRQYSNSQHGPLHHKPQEVLADPGGEVRRHPAPAVTATRRGNTSHSSNVAGVAVGTLRGPHHLYKERHQLTCALFRPYPLNFFFEREQKSQVYGSVLEKLEDLENKIKKAVRRFRLKT